MTVYVVYHQDGQGYKPLLYVVSSEERAWALCGESPSHEYEEFELDE